MDIDRKHHPIIAVAPNLWRGTWMNRQHLLSRLATKGWPVAYSSGPASVWDRNADDWSERPVISRTEGVDGISLVTGGRLTAAWPRLSFSTGLSNRLHAKELRKAAGRDWSENGILYLFHPSFQPLVEILKPRYVAFHVFDVYAEMEEWNSVLDRQMEDLCRRADLLTAASDAMGQALPQVGQDKVRVLPNGVNIKPFANAGDLTCPEDLDAIPHPRIANVGTLNLKIDFTILAEVARTRADWNLVFVGPVNESIINTDAEARAAYQVLREAPNTYFLGGKDRHDVPAYMAHMDVNLVCYLIREGHWASKGYPLKLNEYLAVRKPVVATPTDAIQRYFSSVVDIAATGPEFVAAIDRALEQGGRGTPDARWEIAQANTWENRVDQLDQWLRSLIG
jgi:glycosyltransferase involved in cell wall biosynthesis